MATLHLRNTPSPLLSREGGGPARRHFSRGGAEDGFTYLGLMFVILIMGTGLAAAGEVWHTAKAREKERELLFVGHEFRHAIELYYEAGPEATKTYPRKLDDLLKDPRYPSTRRYLRKIYADPFTNKPEWGLIKAPDGGIMGVHSLSAGTPFKIANFRPEDRELAGKSKYAQWEFVAKPKQAGNPQAVQPGQDAAGTGIPNGGTGIPDAGNLDPGA
jgi:type II secretory pathway pseudopilin PulG